MSDKPLVQQRLAADLAELLLLIKPAEEEARLEAALGFLAGFWEAMCREWVGLDRLRYDRFYIFLTDQSEITLTRNQTGQILHAHETLCECHIPITSSRRME